MRNIFHVLIIVAFFELVYVHLITAVALVAKVVIVFFFEKQLANKFDRIREENASIATSSTNTCESVLDELPDTRNAENVASRPVKKRVAEFTRSMGNKYAQKGHRRPDTL